MPFDVFILMLRVAITLALYAFLGALLYYTWQDARHISPLHKVKTPRLSGKLVVESSEIESIAKGQVFVLERNTSLGRGPTSTIILDDSVVSTRHATITYRNNQWWLTDHQSRNGTTLNDLPVSEAVVISSDDIIGIGHIKLRVQLGN
jgi:hypothetical protein